MSAEQVRGAKLSLSMGKLWNPGNFRPVFLMENFHPHTITYMLYWAQIYGNFRYLNLAREHTTFFMVSAEFCMYLAI